jgi:phosphatidylserine decarboxylase
MNPFSAYTQYVIPKHLLTNLMGCLAESRDPWLKNLLIQQFIKHYNVDMTEAAIENPEAYPTFNDFFIRKLKPDLRPVVEGPHAMASPVDGTIAQIGQIRKNQLLQAKHFYFDLETLLGCDTQLAHAFYDGSYTTLYLAPHDYHRVHMPLTGCLEKTIYVPGKLFSVNRITSEVIPHLYARNERLISIWNTDAGPMAVILVGAMLVGSIHPVWMRQPIRAKQIMTETFSNKMELAKGDELGYFKLGSTVILLFAPNKISWVPSLTAKSIIKFGQFLGNILK